MASRSCCSELQFADSMRRLINKNFIREERASGLLPRNKESVFGDFPAEYKLNNKNNLKEMKGFVPKTLFNEREKNALRQQQAGAGGFKDSRGEWRWARGQPLPPKAGAFRRRPIEPSLLRFCYDRGDIPLAVDHSGAATRAVWCVPLLSVDIFRLLPIFVDGLREKEEPYRLLAVQGTYDLLDAFGRRSVSVVPQLVIPLKKALNTRDPVVVATTLKAMQKLLSSASTAGEALVPYYRQLLPIFNLFISKRKGKEGETDYAQRRREDVSALVEETLKMLEETGGPDAFVNIKYMIPTYQSQVLTGR